MLKSGNSKSLESYVLSIILPTEGKERREMATRGSWEEDKEGCGHQPYPR
jgi:hypothetical protein